MKNYETKDIRNVVLIGSTKSGKTTLAETMLFEGKVISRRGTVEGKNTVSDNTPYEQDNQKSVFSTPLFAEFMDKKFNIIDAPGSDDFCGGAISAFKVCESAILVVNAQQGVEVGTEIFSRYADQYKVPMIVAVNQLDSEKAEWERTLESLKTTYGKKIAQIQIPLNPGPSYDSFIDVLTMKMYKYKDENGNREEFDIPAEYAAQVDKLHEALMDKATEGDDELAMKYLEEGSLNVDEIRKGLAADIAKGLAMPVFCVSAKRDVGIKRLMEFIINSAPVPKNSMEGPAKVFIFKSDVEPHLGDVSYFKVAGGVLREGVDLVNAETGNTERLSAIYAVAGADKVKVPAINAGDIGCTMKLKAGKADTTLGEEGVEPIPHITYPDYKYFCAVKATDKNDDAKVGEALNKIAAQDPTLTVRYDDERRQTVLTGMGEQQINFVKWRLTNEYKLSAEFFEPKVPYRETVTKTASARYRHKKQSGGAGQFGEVALIVCPYVEGETRPTKFKIDGQDKILAVKTSDVQDLKWGGKLEFNNCVVGGAIDLQFMPAILKGINQKMTEGPLTGSYARDIRVYVYDGKMHPVDSKEIAFIIAGRNAFSEAFRAAGPKLLEPVYNVDITTPSDFVGPCMSDLNTRRGMILNQDVDGNFTVLHAKIPLAELYRYSTVLSSLSGGSATFTMSFDSYQPVPADRQKKLIDEYAAAQQSEDE